MIRMVRFLTDSRAAALPLAGVGLFMLLTVIGLVYDLGHLYVVKQELQNAADAGASAGASAMFLVIGKTPAPGTTLCDVAKSTALATVKLNRSDGVALDIPPADAQVGIWAKDATTGKYAFTSASCSNSTNAVHVTTRRTTAVNGPVPTLFARVLGRDFTEVTANATALLGWVKKIRKGLGFPIALGDKYIPDPGEKMWVRMAPDTTDTGTWHTFTDPSASAQDLKKLVNGTKQGEPIGIGDYINLNNGWDTSVVKEMRDVLQSHKTKNEPWIVILPVINGSETYNQSTPVLGFCAFEVTDVGPPSNKYIEGWALGGYVAPAGDDITPIPGDNAALRDSIPRLVY